METKGLAKDSILYGGSTILVRSISWLLTTLFTYTLTREEFGMMTNIYAYTALIIIILTFGMETGFFRFVNQTEKYNPANVYTTVLVAVGTLVGLFLSASLCFLQPLRSCLWASTSAPDAYIRLMLIVLSLDAFSAIPFAYLRYRKKAKKFGALKILYIVLFVVFCVFFLVVCPRINRHSPFLISWFYTENFNLGYVFVANLMATGIQTAFLLPELITGFKHRFDGALVKKMFRYCFPLVIMGIAGMSNQVMDKILFLEVYPSDRHTALGELGTYSACFKIAMIMMMFTQAFRYAYEPFVFEKSREKNARQAYADVMKYCILFGLLVFLGVVFYIDILKYFIRPAYFGGLGIVPVVLFGELFLAIYFNLSFWYKLMDKTYWGTIFSVIACVVIAAVNLLFIPEYGYWACAWASFSGNALIMVLAYMIERKKYTIPYDFKTIGLYTGLALALYAVSSLAPIRSEWLRMAFNTLLLAIYLVVLVKRDLPLKEIPYLNRIWKNTGR
ncbi:MAG: lipopolysaccharide biosynthesis protein [Dysgonamonadaceae bacterium]|jgi:O-antigen/teichoic acid export membrane protein|nr:lipopolysaccharide biosynthesis protein [Dysgonamonadaceae bacterium]